MFFQKYFLLKNVEEVTELLFKLNFLCLLDKNSASKKKYED